jgi:hypothetical protein
LRLLLHGLLRLLLLLLGDLVNLLHVLDRLRLNNLLDLLLNLLDLLYWDLLLDLLTQRHSAHSILTPVL